jgi:hypothetical protein
MFLSLYDEVTNILCVSLKQRITTAVASVVEDSLRCVWTELDYRIDICHINSKACTGTTKPCKYFG